MDPTVHKTSVPSPHNYALSGKIMLSAIIILFSVVLFILFLHFYVRWLVLRRAAARRSRRLRFAAQTHPPSPTKALDPAILNSLPVLLFSPDDDECDCAVCLAEFEEGEKVRSLPPCGHRFHVDCIDMWFGSHSSCPLCRAAVEAVPSELCLEVGSSSSDSGGDGEEGFGPGGGERVGSGRVMKWPINRIVLFRRLFGLSGVAGLDLEEGGGQVAAPLPEAV